MVGKPIPKPVPLLPRRFVMTLFLVGVAYMLLMVAVETMLKNERVTDVWWWTGIPISWLIATLIHWRHFAQEGFLPSAMAAIRNSPGYSILLGGMLPLVTAAMIATPPSAGVPDRAPAWFEVGSMVVLTAAVAGSWVLRRRSR